MSFTASTRHLALPRCGARDEKMQMSILHRFNGHFYDGFSPYHNSSGQLECC
uniref:Uncharacterized protein n=1 Tax=Setaria viridis TaxID=4556 RepID=A0A4U6VI26_SETVI|nr:hypothetical protein SEVIR_3G327903v2 [Setaria viridis]